MPPILSYSLLLLCLATLVFGWWVGGDKRPSWTRRLARYGPILQIAAIAAAYLVLRPGAGDDGSAVMAAAREQNRPVFIDLYSNF